MLVAKYENSRSELLAYNQSKVFLIKEGRIQKDVTCNVRGSNDFSGCIYAEVFGSPYLRAIDKETLGASPTFISNQYSQITAIDEVNLAAFSESFQRSTISKIKLDARKIETSIYTEPSPFTLDLHRMDSTSLLLFTSDDGAWSPFSFLDLERGLITNVISPNQGYYCKKPVVLDENKFALTTGQELLICDRRMGRVASLLSLD